MINTSVEQGEWRASWRACRRSWCVIAHCQTRLASRTPFFFPFPSYRCSRWENWPSCFYIFGSILLTISYYWKWSLFSPWPSEIHVFFSHPEYTIFSQQVPSIEAWFLCSFLSILGNTFYLNTELPSNIFPHKNDACWLGHGPSKSTFLERPWLGWISLSDLLKSFDLSYPTILIIYYKKDG